MEKTHITLKEGGNGGSPRYMALGAKRVKILLAARGAAS